ncbi:CPBP family intramembrane glutamic endopeptidase [Frondihabitans cladoniiphilus]|uniref:CPBP family intramembrane glutamic endopeptidase n=1 Tax=Frondihabitans cladoniiphilus TaxID=715785 RepID=UPI0031EF0177
MTSAYHRLFRIRPTYRWWKPLLALLLGVSFYYALTLVYQEILLAIVRGVGGASASTHLLRSVQQDQQNASEPLVLLFTLGSLSTMLPAMLIAVRLAGLGGWGQLASVLGRIRWRWMLRCLVPGIAYMIITVGLGYVVPASWQGPVDTGPQTATPVPALVVSCILIVLLVPFQASAEEFAFRGLGMQLFGSYLRWPVFAIVLPNVFFALAHSYNVWGKLDVAVLGVSFAYLTWRTGGLEAGIVAHVINNVVVFLLAAPVVATTQSDGSPVGLGITVVASAVYVVIVTWQARRHEPARVAPGGSAVDGGAILHRGGIPGSGVGRAS